MKLIYRELIETNAMKLFSIGTMPHSVQRKDREMRREKREREEERGGREKGRKRGE